jgi:hypothetical protein
MKKILLMFLFGTMTMFSQSTTVRDVTLSYNKVKKVMTLNISPKTMNTDDVNMNIKIEIHKGYSLKMIVNGESHSISKSYFEHTGHTLGVCWYFYTRSTTRYKEIKEDYVYEFSNVRPGEEYILTVSNISDDKYVTNEQTDSIIITE